MGLLKGRHTDQWTRTESSDILLHKCDQLYSDKDTVAIQWRRVVFSKNGAGKIGYLYVKIYKLQGTPHVIQKLIQTESYT